eukprot:m.31762 g.31762  ORF g.31762 m.31762 type:complete len:170 (+) comp4917_c0_seq2:82-591(+)
MMMGSLQWWAMCVLTEPSRARAMAPWPRLPMTRHSALAFSANATISSRGSPAMRCPWTSWPGRACGQGAWDPDRFDLVDRRLQRGGLLLPPLVLLLLGGHVGEVRPGEGLQVLEAVHKVDDIGRVLAKVVKRELQGGLGRGRVIHADHNRLAHLIECCELRLPKVASQR